jgi:hypothetical protein
VYVLWYSMLLVCYVDFYVQVVAGLFIFTVQELVLVAC